MNKLFIPSRAAAAERYWQRIANAPRSVLPADPAALLREAPTILPVIFDNAESTETIWGRALRLERDGQGFVLWPYGRWVSDCGAMRGGGMVSLTMAAADMTAIDALTEINRALTWSEGEAR